MNHSVAVHYRRQRSGFTLIELLVVLAVVGVLVSILLPVLNGVRAKADMSLCVGRMHETGITISNYIVDNNGKLPGPFSDFRFVPWYAKGGVAEMQTAAALLYPYLLEPDPVGAGVRKFPEVFQCPAVQRSPNPSKTIGDNREIITRIINTEVALDGETANAWGKRGTSATEPMSYASLTRIELGRTWAVRECALGYANNNAGVNPGFAFNRTLMHGELFNVLYFDWHVGQVDVEDYKD